MDETQNSDLPADLKRWRPSKEELVGILGDHKEWVETAGGSGKRASLKGADLSNADLSGAELGGADLTDVQLIDANLSDADLFDADLSGSLILRSNIRGALLIGTNFREAKLRGLALSRLNLHRANFYKADLSETELSYAKLDDVDFREANLRNANLNGADLSDAIFDTHDRTNSAKSTEVNDEVQLHADPANLLETNLTDTDLTNATLETVSGLRADKLAGADLTNAKLPYYVADFEELEHVKETSKSARAVFIALLAACAYSWLTIWTTTDAELLPSSSTTALPIIQSKVPIAGFFHFAPLILLAMYFYFHLYLQRLWTGLSSLPAVFQDGRPLDQKAYPWLLNGMVRAYLPKLIHRQTFLSRLEYYVTVALAWWVVPLTLLAFWIRYLPRHAWFGTGLQLALLVIATVAAVRLHKHAGRTLRRNWVHYQWKRPWKDRQTYRVVAMASVAGLLLFTLSYGAINGVNPIEIMSRSEVTGEDPDHSSVVSITYWVPKAFHFVGFNTVADLRERDLSTKSADGKSIGARLIAADLRYADAVLAGLQNADLRGADLQHAILVEANLKNADLSSARLQKSVLGGADMRMANLRAVDLRKAILVDTKLDGAVLSGADLRQADLSKASLQESTLGIAKLQAARLFRANIRKAKLTGANLRSAELLRANLEDAQLLSVNLRNALLSRAILRRANMTQANLREAEIFKTDLYETNLTGANLSGAILAKSDLRNANLQDANIQNTDFRAADLSTAKFLTQGQLDKACGDKETKLPEGLVIRSCPAPVEGKSGNPSKPKIDKP